MLRLITYAYGSWLCLHGRRASKLLWPVVWLLFMPLMVCAGARHSPLGAYSAYLALCVLLMCKHIKLSSGTVNCNPALWHCIHKMLGANGKRDSNEGEWQGTMARDGSKQCMKGAQKICGAEKDKRSGAVCTGVLECLGPVWCPDLVIGSAYQVW